MKLEKFPVIAPDGTEYRVTITEERGTWCPWKYQVSIYKQHRTFGILRFKRIYKSVWRITEEGTRASGDGLISLANDAVHDQIKIENEKLAEKRGIQEAAETFRQWDGKINDTKSEV